MNGGHAMLTDRIAIVTGGASGNGRAIAQGFAQHGARVIVADLQAAVALAEDWGGIDIMVNNAGILMKQPLLDATEDVFHRMIDVNVKSVLFGSQAAARAMIPRGHHHGRGVSGHDPRPPLGRAFRSCGCLRVSGVGHGTLSGWARR